MKIKCEICPHGCEIEENQVGFCRARGNKNGEIIALNYGRITALALDPIEKKPLKRYFSGSMILSAGSFGCNMRCPFCQNHGISMVGAEAGTTYVSPEELVGKAMELIPNGNIGAAFTYNEPLISYEYIMDCARLLREKNLKVILVTNGFINEKPLLELLPFIDAMNIDLKCFSEEFYNELKGGLEAVKRTIELSNQHCHVEVTTLVIPGKNDSAEEIGALAKWLAGISPEIPLHLSRSFPNYKHSGNPTEISKLRELHEIAQKYLNHVYMGNV